MFKLQTYGVEGEFLAILKDDLDNREKRLVLNSQMPDWRKINSGVPQGSVLGPFLLLIFINDLPNGIASIRKIFANETCFFSQVHVVDIFSKELNADLKKIIKWAFNGKCNLILIVMNRQMKLFFLENQTTALVPLLLSTTMELKNVWALF